MPNAAFPERLIDGYREFRGHIFPAENKRFQLLSKVGQRPRIMLIGCCDSRVSPEVIFNAFPGEIFVLRNIANLVPPYHPNDDFHGSSAALEFAVLALKVEHIVVMGHEKCGGVEAALRVPEPLTHSDFIGRWISLLEPTAAVIRADENKHTDEKCRELEHQGIQLSLGNLMTFPWIRSACETDKLKLHGAWFDVGNGELHVLDFAKGNFISI